MENKKRILLIGGGGHCKVVIEAIRKNDLFCIEGIIDKKLEIGSLVCGVPVVGRDHLLEDFYNQGLKYAFISVGSVGDCCLRKRLDNILKKIGFMLPVIIHPSAVVGCDCSIEEGSFIAAGAVVGPLVKIGRNVIINTSASVDHDCEIESFVHVAPGAILSGGVKIGEGSHVGIGANIIQNITVAPNRMVRSAALVTKDIISNNIC